MSFKMYSLYTKPIVRLLARISRRCTVILSTGKKVKFNKAFRLGSCSYEGSMTKTEEQEFINAQMLIGV